MDDDPPDQLDGLPTELKCTVARYVTALNDRKALVLVNKAWSEVTLPILWEALTTDLLLTDRRHMLGLAHPKSNILKHVRCICLLERSLSGQVDHLPTLLAAIPRSQLRRFTSVSALPLSVLNTLLVLHPRLEQLGLPADSTFASAFQYSWTSGRLECLMNITINVDHFSSQGLQKLWNECPKLAHLRLGGSTSTAIHEDAFLPGNGHTLVASSKEGNLNSIGQDTPKLSLESLGLGSIALPQQLDTMFQRIDMMSLRVLVLHPFADASSLLQALATEFVKGHPCLERLRITGFVAEAPTEIVTSLCLLLGSFQGLRSLILQGADFDKVDVDSIVRHGRTLQILCIVNGSIHRQDSAKSFDAADLQKIATGCPYIQQLCLNLYEIEEDRNESDVLGPEEGKAYTPTEFEQALTAIAGMPMLRVLRLTNPPDYRKAYRRPGEFLRYFHRNLQSGFERYNFQARANGVMKYLGECGSNLRILAFSPVEKLRKADNADKHGHAWPHYYYYRGRMTDDKGTDVVVARPLADGNDEWAKASILEQFN